MATVMDGRHVRMKDKMKLIRSTVMDECHRHPGCLEKIECEHDPHLSSEGCLVNKIMEIIGYEG